MDIFLWLKNTNIPSTDEICPVGFEILAVGMFPSHLLTEMLPQNEHILGA